ncbi:2522_t:CDS:2, partial [Racocetra fulgida]
PLTASQQSVYHDRKSLEELDNEFSEEILPIVKLFTDHGDVLQTTRIRCEVCHSIARHIKDFLMLNATQEITIQEGILICSLLRLQTQHTPEKPEIIDLPAPTTKNHITVSEQQNDDDDQKIWVVHLSDWHYDSEYAEGYEVNCGEPVCCRAPNAFGDKATTPAGKWGDYNCDVWAETSSTITDNNNKTANIWRKFFTSAPFFPVIGNHESAPVNSFPTSSISDIASVSWLYSTLSSQWNDWLSDDVLESIEKNGFYSAKLAKYKLRVLGINTNYFYKLNLWLLMRPREEWDPEWMLKWVVNQLDEAEKLGEKVWILGAVGIAYIAPSVTSFKNMNPAFSIIEIDNLIICIVYRVYEIDKVTKKILNHYTYSMDLQEANRLDKPEWKLLYDAKSLYGLENLEPKKKFIIDTNAYKTFKKTASRNHHLDKYGSCSALDTQCRNRIICKLRGTNSGHGPYSDSELCKKHGWLPHLPDDWFLNAALGKHVDYEICYGR